jgi:endonuclease/exonuclease/phosphatase family metal-dependent hydrolase
MSGTIDVVTLNIQFALRIDLARRLFDRVEELSRAHVVLLQEMDAPGTEAIAAHLGMGHVYHAATVHRRTGRDFGNAVLSRWPIVRDRKIVLPHASRRDGSERSATVATLDTPLGAVDVCSLHVATLLELRPAARRAQVRAVMQELRGGASRVIVGGDLNSYRLGHEVAAHAFEWTTRRIGRTVSLLSVDHIFAQGFRASLVGKVSDTGGATDHAAVWARLEPTGTTGSS